MILPTSSTGQSYPDVQGYRIVEYIGGGGFSRVFRAINPKAAAHRVAAVKVVSYAKPASEASRQIHPPDRQALRKEVQIHQVLKHRNVLAFLGVEEHLKDGSVRYVPGLYMILEFGGGGDLFDKIAPDVGVDEDLAHLYFTQLVGALEYIHSQGVAHRDIKPENLLLDVEGSLKLADFGLCSVYRYKGKERELKGACGSLPYIAPEMNGQPYKGEPVDVWSTGIVLFALLVGNTPWDEPTRRSPEFMAYFQGQLYDPWTRIDEEPLSLLRSMLCCYPQERISIEGIKKHPWFQRRNGLMPNGQAPDATSLAERLLQGLVVSGDMDFNLHSDGQRAPVPENISLTQPEAFAAGLPYAEGRLPPSSAMPVLKGGSMDARKLAMSQSVSARRSNVPSASLDGRGYMADAAASQFTQAMNHMTQWADVAGGLARFSPHLTRLFCSASAAEVTVRVTELLVQWSVMYKVDALAQGDTEDGDLLISSSNGGADFGADMDMDMDDGATAQGAARGSSSSASLPRSTSSMNLSRGAKIRVSLTDRRKCALRGEIRIETIAADGTGGNDVDDEDDGGAIRNGRGKDRKTPKTYLLMRRSKGDPLEWRRLFRQLATNPALRPLIVT